MAKSELNDWGRPEYKRADLGEFVRGKYVKRLAESTKGHAQYEKTRKAAKKRKAV